MGTTYLIGWRIDLGSGRGIGSEVWTSLLLIKAYPRPNDTLELASTSASTNSYAFRVFSNSRRAQ